MKSTCLSRVGRPPLKKGAKADSFLHMRVTRAEKATWARAARPRKLSEWVRDALNKHVLDSPIAP